MSDSAVPAQDDTSASAAQPSNFRQRLLNLNTLLIIYSVAALLSTLLKVAHGSFLYHGIRYLPQQNFAIYRNAFYHLLSHQDLYTTFVQEQWDFFKYNPTFALFMGPIAILPYYVGVFVWNLLNALALFFAIRSVPVTRERNTRVLILWFVLLSMLTSIENSQANTLMAALMLGAWNMKERNRVSLSALFLALGFFIKIFGLLALIPCLLSRGRRRRLLVYLALWMAVLAAAPLCVVSWSELIGQYQSWYHLLAAEYPGSFGLSVMSWLQAWFGLEVLKPYVVPVGAVLLLLPLVRFSAHRSIQFRLLVMASVLIWVVIFSHRSESPNMVIAVTGVALWYYFQSRTRVNFALLVLTFVLTCLSSSDIFPRSVRQQIIVPYVLKAFPCILVWLKLEYDLLRFKAGPGGGADIVLKQV